VPNGRPNCLIFRPRDVVYAGPYAAWIPTMRPHRDVAKHIARGASDGTQTRIASLEVQYFTHGLTCGSLISGLNGFHTVILRYRLSYLARICHDAA
jgi:hypothetical protein